MADPRDPGPRHLPPGVSTVIAAGIDTAGRPRALLVTPDGQLGAAAQYHGKTVVDVPLVNQASGDIVAAQGAGNKIKVIGFFGTISLDGTLQFTRGAGATAITGAMTLKAGGGFFGVPSSPEAPLFETGANEKLSIVLSGGTFSGLLRYYVET